MPDSWLPMPFDGAPSPPNLLGQWGTGRVDASSCSTTHRRCRRCAGSVCCTSEARGGVTGSKGRKLVVVISENNCRWTECKLQLLAGTLDQPNFDRGANSCRSDTYRCCNLEGLLPHQAIVEGPAPLKACLTRPRVPERRCELKRCASGPDTSAAAPRRAADRPPPRTVLGCRAYGTYAQSSSLTAILAAGVDRRPRGLPIMLQT